MVTSRVFKIQEFYTLNKFQRERIRRTVREAIANLAATSLIIMSSQAIFFSRCQCSRVKFLCKSQQTKTGLFRTNSSLRVLIQNLSWDQGCSKKILRCIWAVKWDSNRSNNRSLLSSNWRKSNCKDSLRELWFKARSTIKIKKALFRCNAQLKKCSQTKRSGNTYNRNSLTLRSQFTRNQWFSR